MESIFHNNYQKDFEIILIISDFFFENNKHFLSDFLMATSLVILKGFIQDLEKIERSCCLLNTIDKLTSLSISQLIFIIDILF